MHYKSADTIKSVTIPATMLVMADTNKSATTVVITIDNVLFNHNSPVYDLSLSRIIQTGTNIKIVRYLMNYSHTLELFR